MIDYDLWKSDIANAFEKNGVYNPNHKANIIFSAVICIHKESTSDNTEDSLEKVLYLIKDFGLKPSELMNIFLDAFLIKPR